MKRPWHPLERGALALALLAVAALILFRYQAAPYSDPGLWYRCGLEFPETFAHSRRAYAFPLLVHIASWIVGPCAAYLINLPILVSLVAALYFFVRRVALPMESTRPGIAPFCAAIALLLFTGVNLQMLPYLANPYRDPISFLLILLGATALVRYRQQPETRWAPIAAGVALGFAISARETSALVLLPLLFFCACARWREPALPFWRPLGAFSVAFVIALIPFALQNYLVTGNALVPAQATKSQTFKGSLVPGINLDFMAETLPASLELLREHFGLWVPALAALAVLAAARSRHAREYALGLLMPSALLYLLFYGSYIYPVRRYFAVLDLFVIPLAALAIGYVVAAVLRGRARVALQHPAMAALLLLCAAAVAASHAHNPQPRFRLAEIQRLQSAVTAHLPDGACLVGDRPLGEIFRAFGPMRALVINFITPKISLLDPDTGPALHALREETGEVFLLNRIDLNRRVAELEFDLEPVAEWESDDFHLSPLLETDRFRLDRLVPWQSTQAVATVELPAGTHAMLEIQTGRLSKYPRQFVRLYVDNMLVTNYVSDYDSFHRITLPGARTQAVVRLLSDQPLPNHVRAIVHPDDTPLEIGLSGRHSPLRPTRLSSGFFVRPRYNRDPYIMDSGRIRLPRTGPADAVQLVSIHGRFAHRLSYPSFTWTAHLNGKELARATVRADTPPRSLHAAIPAGALPDDEFAIDLALERNTGRAAFIMDRVQLSHAHQQPLLAVRFMNHDARLLKLEGWYRDEQQAGVSWCWTAPYAALWLPLQPIAPSTTLRIRWQRPSEAPAEPPVFSLGGNALNLQTAATSNGLLESEAVIPSDAWPMPAALLEIRAPAWTPSAYGGKDRRTLGIQVFSVEAEPGA